MMWECNAFALGVSMCKHLCIIMYVHITAMAHWSSFFPSPQWNRASSYVGKKNLSHHYQWKKWGQHYGYMNTYPNTSNLQILLKIRGTIRVTTDTHLDRSRVDTVDTHDEHAWVPSPPTTQEQRKKHIQKIYT